MSNNQPIYSVNWVKDPQKGNSIVAGDTIVVSITPKLPTDQDFCTCAVYRDGFPITTNFDNMDEGKVQCVIKTLQPRNRHIYGDYENWPKGKYLLKSYAWIEGRMQYWKDEFEVI